MKALTVIRGCVLGDRQMKRRRVVHCLVRSADRKIRVKVEFDVTAQIHPPGRIRIVHGRLRGREGILAEQLSAVFNISRIVERISDIYAAAVAEETTQIPHSDKARIDIAVA